MTTPPRHSSDRPLGLQAKSTSKATRGRTQNTLLMVQPPGANHTVLRMLALPP